MWLILTIYLIIGSLIYFILLHNKENSIFKCLVIFIICILTYPIVLGLVALIYIHYKFKPDHYKIN